MANELAKETSPYLQQHANNPVDWHAWNPESLRLAREQDKPILLSVGYSACHWCHVMAHESFEDEDTAALMNQHFINIKVDREERPDLDQVYQNAHYLLTQRSGGWPLNMFLSPDGTPFFGGTYFPKQARYNLPSFTDVLQRVAQVYAENRADLAAQGRQLAAALADIQPPRGKETPLNREPIEQALSRLGDQFDKVNGGFGDAPKFLHPAELDLLLRNGHKTGDEFVLHMVRYSLQHMAHGGLYDQLGGGFCRYSVDAEWNIPHFEKMLYDNGLMLSLYSAAWQEFGEPLFARVVEQTANWVLREMQSPEGGYYSSLDADSEHEEGKFYLWQIVEVRQLLTEQEYEVAKTYYGIEWPPNFEERAWNPRVRATPDFVARHLQVTHEQTEALIASVRGKLFAAREKRVHPGRDEKILGGWNGLMIAGMARAARAFGREDWLRSAQRAMDFVRTALWRDGKLLATCKDGKAHLNAYLDDHAFLLNAALELMQTEFRKADLDFAVQLADALLERFEDKQNGGFFFTSHDHEALIQRNKTAQDDATPSGNGIAAQALLRLALLTGDERYRAAAERCLKLFFPALQQAASYHCSLCTALAELLQPSGLLVLRGKEASKWQAALQRRHLPDVITVVLSDRIEGLPETLDKPSGEQTTAWLCRGTQCLPPVTDIDELLRMLQVG
ncbi:thioredoxin domain-containing protein [Ferrigenium kumadai]|uniref:Thioredoxin domain-containing protein n=1 Tax=Ferrigenium kumadai TaxID=1682490 RepID=A0AAN1SYR1_9PROT|nr:thioredoxin domain-containing protein [Ferrigenium kumadai]BBI99492.1 thioredoxin domain-containing protein [Ferrigenium kumadai]